MNEEINEYNDFIRAIEKLPDSENKSLLIEKIKFAEDTNKRLLAVEEGIRNKTASEKTFVTYSIRLQILKITIEEILKLFDIEQQKFFTPSYVLKEPLKIHEN